MVTAVTQQLGSCHENRQVRNGQDEQSMSKEKEGQENPETGFGYRRSPREYPSLRTKNPNTLGSRGVTLDIHGL